MESKALKAKINWFIIDNGNLVINSRVGYKTNERQQCVYGMRKSRQKSFSNLSESARNNCLLHRAVTNKKLKLRKASVGNALAARHNAIIAIL